MRRSQASRGFLCNVTLQTRKAGVEGCASSNTQAQVALKRVGVKRLTLSLPAGCCWHQAESADLPARMRSNMSLCTSSEGAHRAYAAGMGAAMPFISRRSSKGRGEKGTFGGRQVELIVSI